MSGPKVATKTPEESATLLGMPVNEALELNCTVDPAVKPGNLKVIRSWVFTRADVGVAVPAEVVSASAKGLTAAVAVAVTAVVVVCTVVDVVDVVDVVLDVEDEGSEEVIVDLHSGSFLDLQGLVVVVVALVVLVEVEVEVDVLVDVDEVELVVQAVVLVVDPPPPLSPASSLPFTLAAAEAVARL